MRLFAQILILLSLSFWAKAQDFDSYRKCVSCSDSQLLEFFNKADKPFESFILEPALDQNKTAVLFHGLSDSPYYMKDLAKLLYQNGYRVIVPLLKGHGYDYSKFEKVTSEEWQRQSLEVVQKASASGQEIVLGGFSNGGLLASLLAANPQIQARIKALLLFSPALRLPLMHAMIGRALHFLKVMNQFLRISLTENLFFQFLRFKAVKNNCIGCTGPIRYSEIPLNGLFQVHNGIENYKQAVNGQGIRVPTFMALSSMDKVIHTEQVARAFVRDFQGPKHLFWIDGGDEKGLKPPKLSPELLTVVKSSDILLHSSIALEQPGLAKPKEFNPHFQEMKKSILDLYFISRGRSCSTTHQMR